MLDAVPGFIFEREVVGGGDVPAQIAKIHGQPCDGRRDQPMREAAQWGRPNQWVGDPAQNGRGQATQQRNDWEP